ncbi:MAG: two-component system response regulator [Thermoanaerobaculia bacterium]
MSAASIFIVDDDPAVLEAVTDVLADDGYRVAGAVDSRAALLAVLSDPPDLLVLDVIMPGLNGWELCEIVRRQAATREVPVLFLTGRGDVRDQITALQVGGTDHLKKPFRAEELRGKVRTLTAAARREPSR